MVGEVLAAMPQRTFVALFTALLASSLTPAPAAACGNEIVRVYVLPIAVRRAERLERLMAQGNSRAAYRLARELEDAVGDNAFPLDSRDASEDLIVEGEWSATEMGDGGETFQETRHPERATALARRVKMLLAILVIRVDGQITRSGRLARSVHPDVRAEHMTEARAMLSWLVDDEENENPRLIAYNAEAQASEPAAAANALATLRDLGARDLVTDPLTWVALAKLETGQARTRALERCSNAVARGAARVCRASDPV
ncbi:MAG: hypothetical protein AB8H86_15315 [Polyangiales bacterium]